MFLLIICYNAFQCNVLNVLNQRILIEKYMNNYLIFCLCYERQNQSSLLLQMFLVSNK